MFFNPLAGIVPLSRIALFSLGLSLLMGFFPVRVLVDAQALAGEPDSGAVVCPPGVYLTPPDDCFALGPSAYLTELAGMGIPYPIRPLAASAPDPALTKVPYWYFKVDADGSPLYPTLDAAISKSGTSRYLGPGFIYIAYIDRVDTGRGVYYMLPSAEWIPGKGSRISYSDFQGLEFRSTPRNAFGWVLSEVQVKSTPGYGAPNTGKRFYRFNIVQVYNTQEVDGMKWHLIGPDEWIEGRLVGVVYPSTNPPEGVNNGRWIDVNLEEQTLTVYDDYQLVFATLVSTGIEPFWTQPGLFPIYERKETEDMSGSAEADRSDYYYLQKVPYTMYFDQARALHGTYWHTYFGYPQSRGCVNLSIGDARWVFDWGREGDWVYVHDPSGRTPTDPSLYGAGAP